jgi:pantothenate kinase type III
MKIVWTIDIGNSHPHIGKFVAGKLLKVTPLKKSTFAKNDLVFASVVGSKKTSSKMVRPAKKRQQKKFLGMPVDYAMTLGEDRLLCARYLFDLYPKKKIILIDAGTFTTIDAIDAGGFRGGYILPGQKLLEECYQKGANLKKVKFDYKNKDKDKDGWQKNTPQAMSSALKKLTTEFTNSLLKKYPNHKIVLTGGNAKYFQSQISQNKILAVEPHLIHHALYHCGVILCS